jgi:ribosomal protein S18 acetylase RimI-like enzyme
MTDELAAVDRYCDAVPRSAASVEEFGGLRLFVPTGDSYHPWYARPSGPPVAAEDLDAVLDRQRALTLPLALEWVQGRPDGLDELALAAGMQVVHHPLLVASSEELLPLEGQVDVRLPGADLARAEAVAELGFAHPGTQVGEVGAEAVEPQPADARRVARVASGHPHVVAAYVDGFPVARGGMTVVGGVAEITGVTTLPAYRRQGFGSAVTAVLAEHAVRRGARLLWLSATDDAVARVYSRLGFREVGTSCIASA